MKKIITLVLMVVVLISATGIAISEWAESTKYERIVYNMGLQEYPEIEDLQVKIDGYDPEEDNISYSIYDGDDLAHYGWVDASWAEYVYCG